MDTEGLGATGSNIEIDSKILACSILFAAKVYFFVCGKVDSNLLSSLQCAIGTATWLKDAANQQCFNYQKPQLVVVIKDLTLDLQDDNGDKVEPTAYLHLCLEKYAQSNPQFKSAIESLFSDIICLTMSIPCADQDMKEMKNLSPKFKVELAAVARDAYNRTNMKVIAENTYLNGPVLLQMVQGLCAALTQPGAPRLMSVWESALQQAAIERRHQLLMQIQNKMHTHFENRLTTLRTTTIMFDDIVGWLNNALCKTPHQVLKFDEIAQILRAVKDECKTCDDAQMESNLQQIDASSLLSECSQWCSMYLPQSLRERIEPHFKHALKLESELEDLKKDNQLKAETIDTLDAQIAMLTSLPSGGVDATHSSDVTSEIQLLQQQLQRAQTHNEELLLINTTFQAEFRDQIAMMTNTNAQVRAELDQATQQLSKHEKEQQEITHTLREKSQIEQELRTTVKEFEKREANETRKRKFDETLMQQLRASEQKSKQTIQQLQQQLDARTSKQQELQLALVQAQCKSMFSTQPNVHRS